MLSAGQRILTKRKNKNKNKDKDKVFIYKLPDILGKCWRQARIASGNRGEIWGG